jgi:hypothetical protein
VVAAEAVQPEDCLVLVVVAVEVVAMLQAPNLLL